MNRTSKLLIATSVLLAGCFWEDEESPAQVPEATGWDTIGVMDSGLDWDVQGTHWSMGVANLDGRLYALSMTGIYWVNDSGTFERIPNQQWKYQEPGTIGYKSGPDGWQPQFLWYGDALLVTDDEAERWVVQPNGTTFDWLQSYKDGAFMDRLIGRFQGVKPLDVYANGGVEFKLESDSMVRSQVLIESSGRTCKLNRSLPFQIGDTVYADSCSKGYLAISMTGEDYVHAYSGIEDSIATYYFPNASRLCAINGSGIVCREQNGSWTRIVIGSSLQIFMNERMKAGTPLHVGSHLVYDNYTVLAEVTGKVIVIGDNEAVARNVEKFNSDTEEPSNVVTIWNNRFVFTGFNGKIFSLPLSEVLSWRD